MPTGTVSFKFIKPNLPDTVSDITKTALELSALAERLANENRTLVKHKGGRSENVAEHSNMLGIIAPAIANQYFPELDANLVARFAPVHDIIEAYVGDTPTQEISVDGLKEKQQLEHVGLTQLKNDFQQLPSFIKLIDTYEQQLQPEARFVRMIDKWLPLLIHFQEGGKTLRSYITKDALMVNSNERCARWRQEYPEFEIIISVREELALLAVNTIMNA